MIKVTIILLILSLVSNYVLKLVMNSLEPLEALYAATHDVYPTRVYVVTAIMLLLWAATVICGIIAIITL